MTELLVVVGVLAAALAYVIKVLVPRLFGQFDGALQAFRADLTAERELHRDAVQDIVKAISGLDERLRRIEFKTRSKAGRGQ